MRFGLLGLVVLAGCAGSGSAPTARSGSAEALPQLPPPASADRYATSPVASGISPASLPFPDGVDAALTPIDKAMHDRARDEARAGRLHEAKRLLGHLAFSYPEHEILIAQYNAVGARIDEAQAAAKAGLEGATLRTPPPAPVAYTLIRRAPVTADGAIPKLVKRSQTKNNIVDDEAWFQKNDLRTPEYFVERPGEMLWAPGIISTKIAIDLKSSFFYVEHELSHRFLEQTLPIEMPPAYGSLPLLHAIDSKPYVVAIYGDRVIAIFDAAKKVIGVFDLAAYAFPPANKTGKVVVGSATLTTAEGTQHAEITAETNSIFLHLRYAVAADGVLYVEHAANSYTKEAKGQTGYITALDIATGEMLWRSAPLVANGNGFALVGGGVVCGFGFTAEPRFVFVLDRATGAKKQTLQVSTSPSFFIPKGNAIYVRGYDSDFVFDVGMGTDSRF